MGTEPGTELRAGPGPQTTDIKENTRWENLWKLTTQLHYNKILCCTLRLPQKEDNPLLKKSEAKTQLHSWSNWSECLIQAEQNSNKQSKNKAVIL